MSESAEELYSKRGEVILGPASGTVREWRYIPTITLTRIDSVVEAGKSYIITFNSDDPEWADMTLYRTPGNIRTPLQRLNSNTYIVKFTATGAESGIGIYNLGSGKRLSFTNYTLYEYQNQTTYPDNVLRPFKADKMYYRNQEVQKLYLGSRLVWEATTKVIEVEVYRYVNIFSSSVEISPSITPPELDEIDYIMLDGNRIEGDQIASISSMLITFNRALYSLGIGEVQSGAPVTIHLL